MKKIFIGIVALVLAIAIGMAPAEARRKHQVRRAPLPPPAVVVNIDISSQSMAVRVNGWPYGYWNVSTARAGYSTPRGSYRVTRMAKVYYSKKYDNAPMPNSVFFYGGYAIHGTGHIRSLGRPASHGCVRLHPANAARLFALVQQYGPRRTRITLTN
jgi:lipoprotein-anchoring transpeptidase ErfK/SrfK